MTFLETSETSFQQQNAWLPNSAGSPIRLASNTQPLSVFRAGAEIYAQGEKCGGLYRVEFGAVRIYRLLADGRRQISAFHLPDEIFGFEADDAHHFFAEAICDTGVRALRAAPGKDLPGELLPLALKDLVRAQEHLLVLGRQNAIERIAAFLTDLAERQGEMKHVELPMSRSDIGDYLGLTVETVSRVFSKLKQIGVIKLASLRSIDIVKWQALQDMAA